MGKNSKTIIEYKGLYDFQKERKKITIPFIQREYRWKATQIEEFLDDLKSVYLDSLDNKSEDYIPNVGIIYLKSKDADACEFEIIDGQQRLTTLLLVLLYLKQDHQIEIEADLDEYNEQLKSIFKDRNFEGKNNLIDSYNCIKNWFENNRSYFDEKLLCEFIWKELRIFEFRCLSEKMAVDTFIRLNSRGEELSFVDLLKSYLFQNKQNLNISDDIIIQYVNKTSNLIASEKGKGMEYEKLVNAYKHITKSYISSDSKGSQKIQYRIIVDYIDRNKKQIKSFFFGDWVKYIDLYLSIETKKKNVETDREIEAYKKFCKMYRCIGYIGKKDYHAILIRLYLECYITRKLDKSDYEKAISNLLKKFLDVEIENFIQKLNGNDGKFDSALLKYKDIFNFMNKNGNLDLSRLAEEEFENEFNLKSKQEIIEQFSVIKIKDIKDNKDYEKLEWRYKNIEKLIDFVID